MSTKKLRVGHIGTKHDHSRDILQCLEKFPEIFEVVGVVEDDPKWRAEVENTEPYCRYPFMTEEQLFNSSCDFMVCEGFEYDLPHAALRCVENGIPVHIDKPAGNELEVFERVLDISRRKKLPLQMGYMYRYNPAVVDCLDLVRSGRLGEIHSVTAIMSSDHKPEKRQWLDRFDEGIMLFLGCHMVDLIYMMQGRPEEVVPFLTRSGIFGCTAIDEATAVFRYKNGVSIAQSNSTELGGGARRQLVVNGSLGSFEIRPLEYNGVAQVRLGSLENGRLNVKYEEHKYPHMTYLERYDDMMLDFAAMVRGEKENPFDYDYELECQKLVLAACGRYKL